MGRVWTREELTRLGDICLKHKVIVISDEIHSAFVFKGKHTVFTGIKEEFKEIGIVCTSPSKTFNIAGLQVSNIFIANEELRKKFRRRVNAAGYRIYRVWLPAKLHIGTENEWLDAVLKYIKANAEYMKAFLQEKLPKVKMTEPEGTYLVWLDFREYGLRRGELDQPACGWTVVPCSAK